MALACAAPRCAIPRRHQPGCDTDGCRGCLPALAQDGLRLCPLHTTRIATDALRCAELDHEIEQVLASSGQAGERTTGTADHGTVINERAVDTRRDIRAVLVSWCKLVTEERGHTRPPNNLDAIAAYLAANNKWLSAHPAAGDCSGELADLQRRAWSVAYPTGARIWTVGPCPAPGCDSTIKVVLRASDSVVPSELVCDADPPHRWPYSQTAWRRLGHQINERYLSPAEVAERWTMPLGSVYRLASEYRWRRTQDGRRPALYLAEDVRATLDSRPAAKDHATSVVAP
jgi:hypothetical protein